MVALKNLNVVLQSLLSQDGDHPVEGVEDVRHRDRTVGLVVRLIADRQLGSML
jgi:hypothetical protein